MSVATKITRHPNICYQITRERLYYLKLTFQETKLFHEAIKEAIDNYIYQLSELDPYKSTIDPYNDTQHLKQLDYFICALRDIEIKADNDQLCQGGFW